MKKTIRTIALALSLVTVASLFACAKAPATETKPVTEETYVPVTASYTYSMLDKNKQYHFYEATAKYGENEDKFLFRVPIVDSYTENASVAKKIDPQINTLGGMAKTTNVFVYVASCLEDFEMMIDIAPAEYKGANLKYFEENLSDSVWLGYLNPRDIAERNSMYYLTDHHWNAYGMDKAYKELVAAMQAKYPDITPREGTLHVTEAEYFGSLCRSTNKYEYKDTFAYYDYALPEHETVILRVNKDEDAKLDGGNVLYASETPVADNMAKYAAGDFTKDEKYDHYVNFYPICDTVTYPENKTGRNMLFIGDSFSLGLQELVASHFDKSYFFYSDGTKKLFESRDFGEFCQENGITDVVIVEQSTRLLYDFYDYSGPALCSFTVAD